MEQEQQKKKDLFLPISIVIAAVVIGGAVIYSNGLKSTGKNGATPTPSGEVVEMDIISEDNVLGDSKAELTMFEFSDYECPYCAKFHKLTRPEIISNYVDTGKMKTLFRAMPFHSNSLMDIQASWCADAQNKYWEMHELMFTKKDVEETLTADSLIKYAEGLGLNKVNFAACLTDAKDTEKINEIATIAQNAGILATPISLIAKDLPIELNSAYIISELQGGSSTIYIDGGVIIIGSQPFSVYQTEIDKLLD
jgi:protein-disulfide isomerase